MLWAPQEAQAVRSISLRRGYARMAKGQSCAQKSTSNLIPHLTLSYAGPNVFIYLIKIRLMLLPEV